MQEFALIPLLTETSQPVLAHDGLVPPDMAEWTGSSPLTGGPNGGRNFSENLNNYLTIETTHLT